MVEWANLNVEVQNLKSLVKIAKIEKGVFF